MYKGLVLVVDLRNQTVAVSVNVEHCAVANRIRVQKVFTNIHDARPFGPLCRSIPGIQRRLSRRMFSG
jgi:hypothetical protein